MNSSVPHVNLRSMLRLALPICLGSLGIILMAMVDMHFVGRISAAAVGALGVGHAFFSFVLVVGIGWLQGAEFYIAFNYGSGKRDECRHYFIQSLWVALLFSLACIVILFFASDFIPRIVVDPEQARLSQIALKLFAVGLPLSLIFIAMRIYLQAIGSTTPAMLVLLSANVINYVANDALIFGKYGAPAMGFEGSPIATLVSRLFMMLAMGIYLLAYDESLRALLKKTIHWKLQTRRFKEIIRMGLAASLQLGFEVGAFGLSTLLASRFGAVSSAAHQIVLNLASFTFMVPMGVSAATAVLVAQSLGARRLHDLRRAGTLGFGLGAGFMLLTGILLLAFPEYVLRLYIADAQVMQTALGILFFGALFQLSDGIQAVGTGALRGLGDTRFPMIVHLCGHWGVGLPVGCFLAFSRHWETRGLWCGFFVGLTAVAAALIMKWMRASRTLQLT